MLCFLYGTIYVSAFLKLRLFSILHDNVLLNNCHALVSSIDAVHYYNSENRIFPLLLSPLVFDIHERHLPGSDLHLNNSVSGKIVMLLSNFELCF